MVPFITNPEFATHIGTNCGPVELVYERDLLLDLLLLIGDGICDNISLDLMLCVFVDLLELFLEDTDICGGIGIVCRECVKLGGSFVDLLGV